MLPTTATPVKRTFARSCRHSRQSGWRFVSAALSLPGQVYESMIKHGRHVLCPARPCLPFVADTSSISPPTHTRMLLPCASTPCRPSHEKDPRNLKRASRERGQALHVKRSRCFRTCFRVWEASSGDLSQMDFLLNENMHESKYVLVRHSCTCCPRLRRGTWLRGERQATSAGTRPDPGGSGCDPVSPGGNPFGTWPKKMDRNAD